MSHFTKTVACCCRSLVLTSVSQAGEAIAYRLSKTKEMHFDNGRKAAQHLAAVRKLGCKARMDSHGATQMSSTDLPRWQVLEVDNDKLAHQWENWLKKLASRLSTATPPITGQDADAHGSRDHSGHDHAGHSHTGHNHGPGIAEEVSYVLPNWKTIHSRDVAQMSELVALMKGLGCEVRTVDHGGHRDVSIVVLKRKHIEVASASSRRRVATLATEQRLRDASQTLGPSIQIGDCRISAVSSLSISANQLHPIGECNEDRFHITHHVYALMAFDCRWLFRREFHWPGNSRTTKHGGLA